LKGVGECGVPGRGVRRWRRRQSRVPSVASTSNERCSGGAGEVGDDGLAFTFCRVCGVRTFAHGELASLGGPFRAVHIPTLDLSLEQRAASPVRYVNGRDGRYHEVPEHTEAVSPRGPCRSDLRGY
jgi:hypothetical protein